MGPGFLLLLATVSGPVIRDESVALRRSCAGDSETLATLARENPVEIRFALVGDYPCYKVTVTAGGRRLDGYVPQSAVAGSEEFDRARRDAPSLTAGTAPAATPAPPVVRVGDAAFQAAKLFETKQPAEALRAAEAGLRARPRDPGLLAIAALSAYHSDDRRRALDYLEQALEVQPDQPGLAQLRTMLRRELGADRGGERLIGSRFMLRYDGTELEPELARTLLAVLDHEHARISEQLGCQAGERIPVIVQAPESFRQTTGAREWTAGRYDGRIRIALVEGRRIGDVTRRIAAHEIVHACLAELGQWPAWFHEGMAQRLSGETLAPAARSHIREAVRAGRLPKLGSLARNWSAMGTADAVIAYQYSLAAADAFFEAYQAYGVRNVLRDPASVAAVAAAVDKRLAE